jgi:hypothetical protein
MIAYVVTEGPNEVELLERLVPQKLREDVVIFAAGGTSAIKSFARSVLVMRQTPVVIVVDADTVSSELLRERRQSFEEVVGSVAGSVPFKIILAVPALEAIFFEHLAIWDEIAGQPLPDHLVELAKVDPQGALMQLLPSLHIADRMQLVDALSPAAVQLLQQAEPIRELLQFLRHAHELAAA